MKSLIPVLFLFLSVGFVSAQQEVSPEITGALSKGDAASLSEWFGDHVELVVGNVNDVFSKQQAAGIVADYFRKNKVSSFQVLHRGTKDASAFVIGSLKAGNSSFRVYVLVRKTANKSFIQQLRIESTND